MGEQTLNRMKKIVGILLAVFFVATLTAVSASACNDRHYEDDHAYGDYDGHDNHCGDSYNDYGDSYNGCDDYDSYDNYGDYDDYDDYDDYR